ncbi:hypothetical protein GJAV_G00258370 [Gymnothorax javanicus]|nr:hypothetical protein GJAV_G00258370 [Gymnothorax javanicus]
MKENSTASALLRRAFATSQEMSHVFHFTLIVGLILWAQCSLMPDCSGSQARTCEECIAISPTCAWCKNKSFDVENAGAVHCDSRVNLRRNGCPELDIIDPDSSHSIIRRGASIADGLNPVNMRLELRPGKPHTFMVDVKVPRKYKVEVYYLTSWAFVANETALRGAPHLGGQVLSTVQEIGPTAYSIGYGLFGHQNQTNDTAECREGELGCKEVFSMSHFPSLETLAEAAKPGPLTTTSHCGLQAVLQAAACWSRIGTPGRTRLLVYTSDQSFCAAGQTPEHRRVDDGGVCLLKEGQQGLNQQLISCPLDCPSVAKLAHVLSDNNIQVIFAVTEDVAEKYKELSDQLPKSTVAVLPPDLRNITAVIADAYKVLLSKVVVSHTHIKGLNISYTPLCSEEQESTIRGACSIAEINRKFSLKVTVSTDTCLDPQSLQFRLLGVQSGLAVELKSVCNCQCEDDNDRGFCSYSGRINCGVCNCDPGFVGKRCQCTADQNDDAPCREREGSLVCSGRGSCVCGQCQCETTGNKAERIHGQFCECDNFSCYTYDGILCAGNGRCECGECVCAEGFSGEVCQHKCSKEVNRCTSFDGTLCNNHGTCQCNKCKCEKPYRGHHCEECPTCQNICHKVAPCIECMVSGASHLKDKCGGLCREILETMPDLQPSSKVCSIWVSGNCNVRYSMSRRAGTEDYDVVIRPQLGC